MKLCARNFASVGATKETRVWQRREMYRKRRLTESLIRGAIIIRLVSISTAKKKEPVD